MRSFKNFISFTSPSTQADFKSAISLSKAEFEDLEELDQMENIQTN